MSFDKIAKYNKSRWEALAKANIAFSRPWENLSSDNAGQMLDPTGLLGEVRGRKVLCLASGGGQQSVAFALLGADVTVLDFCETQLNRDLAAAAKYGVSVKTVQGDMRELSVLKETDFDIVWQPPSINNVPESRRVIEEVSRVLKAGGFYRLEFANPLTKGMDERSWDGQGYPLNRFYIDGEQLEDDFSDWEFWDEKGNCQLVPGPKQYRHTLSTIINSLADCGFIILRFWEDIGAGSEPGTWDHYTAVAPAIFGVWCQLAKGNENLVNPPDSSESESKRKMLVEILKRIPPEIKEKLDVLKKGSKGLKRPDFIWHFLLQSFATMGNSRGWKGLIGNQDNYTQVSFERLSKLNSAKRVKIIEQVLRDARVRMPQQKTQWLSQNCDLIIEMGGLRQAKRQALACSGTQAKIDFLKRFQGIGDKYARNIWMDVYHPDFHNSIAIDERIKRITETLGYTFTNYPEHEKFYLDIANETYLQGWELDRLLYNYKDWLLDQLNVRRSID
jgi:SAM-dependent methyltransferase